MRDTFAQKSAKVQYVGLRVIVKPFIKCIFNKVYFVVQPAIMGIMEETVKKNALFHTMDLNVFQNVIVVIKIAIMCMVVFIRQ